MTEGMLVIDLTKVEALEAVDPGIYAGQVFEAEETESSKGKPMLSVTFKLTDPEVEGRKVYRNYVLQENSLWAVQQFLKAVGAQFEGEVNLVLADLAGLPCRLNIKNREWEGVLRSDVQTVLPPSDDDAELADLIGGGLTG